MSIRETLGLNKKKQEQEFTEQEPQEPVAQIGGTLFREAFELTCSEPPGAVFEVGEEITPKRVFRLTGVAKYFRIMGRGSIKEHKRKRLMRNYLLPVELLEINEFGKLESKGEGMLTSHSSLGQILDGCEIGTCVSIMYIGDGSQNRYKVNKVKVQA